MRCPHCQSVAMKSQDWSPMSGYDSTMRQYHCQNDYCRCIFYVVDNRISREHAVNSRHGQAGQAELSEHLPG